MGDTRTNEELADDLDRLAKVICEVLRGSNEITRGWPSDLPAERASMLATHIRGVVEGHAHLGNSNLVAAAPLIGEPLND
jgi:hypothetical protein